ncbi:hypothetical protein [Actinoallomurus rhizosphaericola]|uniref:hypothetical protein n=1 Tax=Actinoallomurus rhizosphaericola TaxID=2952536 RepID=UPI0020904329|nr:hypothetical protein [Actinoallomurus rhizosphaericola]MCO5993060.1 hypothetical protein [Actinoallomurus rhizosphaericola]
MDEVVLRRRGFVFSPDRPLQIAGYVLGFAGALGLAYLLGGREILKIFPVWIVMIVAFSLYPMKVLIADRDGVSILSRGGRTRLSWDRIAKIVVFDRAGGRVTVGIRTEPDDATRARPWTRLAEVMRRIGPAPRLLRVPGRDEPFALAFETVCGGVQASELADRFRRSVPVPIAELRSGDAEPYSVRAPFRSALPDAAFLAVWNGLIGTIWVVVTVRQDARAWIPLGVMFAGFCLILTEQLIPRAALMADGTGLRFGEEFLAWDEIQAIRLGAATDGTDLIIRTTAAAALVEPEVRRRLTGTHVDPARLAAAVPPGITVDHTTVT